MIYIYVEDKKEGLYLMRMAASKYNIDTSKMWIDNFNGIFNLITHIESLNLNKDDAVYYVYDSIEGNTDIPIIVKNANERLKTLNISVQVHLLPIVCLEYHILVADNIELFIHRACVDIVEALKMCNVDTITETTKSLDIFSADYETIRNRQKKLLQRKKTNVTENEIEITITAEKLCKEILKRALQNDLTIFDATQGSNYGNCGTCWMTDCCYKKTRSCNISIKSNLLTSQEKLAILFQESHIYNVLNKIAKNENVHISDKVAVDLLNVNLNSKIANCINQNQRDLKECSENVNAYLADGYNEEQIKKKCKDNGYADYIINKALSGFLKN